MHQNLLPFEEGKTFSSYIDKSVCYRVVTEAREWRHYKQLCGLSTPMEEGMFSAQSTPDTPQILLRPKETVHIPFKYQSFQADHSVMPQVS